jgi:hypothetical protein
MIKQGAPVQSKFSGKWACTFQAFITYEGKEHLSSSCESGAVWFDKAAALVAGERALALLERTGRYPNLCEVW